MKTSKILVSYIMFLFLTLFIFSIPSYAQSDGSNEVFEEFFKLRLLGGFGYTRTDYAIPDKNNLNYSGSIQLQQFVAAKYAAGFDFGYVHLLEGDKFNFQSYLVAVMLERRIGKYGIAQIGLGGYMSDGDNSGNPFGVRTKLGLDFPFAQSLSGTVVFNNDIIFESSPLYLYGFEFGITVTL